MRKKKQSQSSRNRYLLLALCVVVFVWATILASSHRITGAELSVFRIINNLSSSLRLFFLYVTQLGSVWIYFGLILILLGRKHTYLALRFFIVGGAAYVLTEIFKNIIERGRPDLILSAVKVRELSIGVYGFPSGHTALATAMSLVLVEKAPKQWRWLALAWIVLVGVSRIYLGAHAPLDVLGGASVGIFVVTLEKLLRKLEKPLKKYI